MERTYIDTLAQLIARSPTCYHAAATAAELLAAAGYAPLGEGQRWQLRPGGKYYMTRGGSALIAFRVPERAPEGFRLAAAHGDSPCFKLKENAALRDGGYLRLNTTAACACPAGSTGRCRWPGGCSPRRTASSARRW